MKDQIKTIELRRGWVRVLLLLVPLALVAVGAWYGVRWCIGSTMTEWLPQVNAATMNAEEMEATQTAQMNAAQAAVKLTPDDPQGHFTIARLRERSFLPEELPGAAREYEEAARLSPNDYRLFMELGRVRGVIGDARGGEQALRRAVELAPGYPEPRWYLGNLLLRQGRTDEAFSELRRASEANPEKFRPQVLELSWRFYKGDIPSVLKAAGSSAQARGALMDYLLNQKLLDQKLLDDARQLWEGFNAGERRDMRATGEKLSLRYLEAKRFHDMLEMQRELAGVDATTTTTMAMRETFTNGGFETAVGAPGKNAFEWQVVPLAGVQMGFDERVRQEGTRSLRLAFNAPGTLNFRNISQLVTVEARARYRIEYFVRTEDLKSAATLNVEVVDAAEPGRVLAASTPLAIGTTDWGPPVALEFTTGATTEAVTLRIVSQQPCPAATCPIFGKVWYDNFTLKRA